MKGREIDLGRLFEALVELAPQGAADFVVLTHQHQHEVALAAGHKNLGKKRIHNESTNRFSANDKTLDQRFFERQPAEPDETRFETRGHPIVRGAKPVGMPQVSHPLLGEIVVNVGARDKEGIVEAEGDQDVAQLVPIEAQVIGAHRESRIDFGDAGKSICAASVFAGASGWRGLEMDHRPLGVPSLVEFVDLRPSEDAAVEIFRILADRVGSGPDLIEAAVGDQAGECDPGVVGGDSEQRACFDDGGGGDGAAAAGGEEIEDG